MKAIHAYLHEHKDTQLVIIDTLARIREGSKGEDVYLDDSQLGAAIQSVAFAGDAAILLVHHMRKQGHSDFLLGLSGSAGLPGAADVVMGLERKRHEHKAQLHVTGRDVPDKSVSIYWTRRGWVPEVAHP